MAGSLARQAGNIFFTLFGAVGLVGVLGATSMTVLKGPVRSMAEITKRTIAENNMIASGKLALMAASSQPDDGDCDGDARIEPLPFGTTGTGPKPVGGGYLPAGIGASLQDPWGNDYGYCVWDHGANAGVAGDNDGNCGSSTNFLAGSDTQDKIVLAVLSSGPNRTYEVTCGAHPAYLTRPSGSDDVVLAYTYAEARSLSGGVWNIEEGDVTTAEIAKNLSVKDDSGTEQLAFDTASKQLSLGAGGMGLFPSVKTDFLQQLTAGSIEFLSNIKLGPSWLSGDGGNEGIRIDSAGNVTASGTVNSGAITSSGAVTAASLSSSGTLGVTGTATLGQVNAGATGVTTLASSGLATLNKLAVTQDAAIGTALSTGTSLAVGTTLTTGGTITPGGNIVLGAKYLSGDGGNEGIQVDGNGAVFVAGSSAGYYLKPRDGTGDQWVLYNPTGDDFRIWRTTGGDAVTIQQDGDLGIGIAPVAKLHVAGTGKFGGELDMSSFKIVNLANPTSNADAATKAYVDSAIVAGVPLNETDPQVGDVTTAGRICQADGTKIECTATAASLGDNLGNHTAAQNIALGTNWLSGDGGNEGITDR